MNIAKDISFNISKKLTPSEVNTAPTIGNYSVTTDDVTPLSSSVSGTDAEGDSLTYTKATNPTNGTVTVNANGSYTYTPNGGYYGTDSFNVTATDPSAASATSTVTVTVTKSKVSLFTENVVADGGTINASLTRSEFIALPSGAKTGASIILIGDGCKTGIIYAMAPSTGALIPLTFARSGVTTRINASGAVESVASGMPAFEYDSTTLAPKGWSIMPSRANLFLNSQTPVTQNVTLVNGSTYTVHTRHTSTANITLSGATPAGASIAVTPGKSNFYTFVASSTTLAVTVPASGVNHVQVELGAYPGPEIWTSGSTVSRPAETSSTTVGSWYSQTEGIMVSHSYFGRTADAAANNLWQFDDGTANYRNYVSFASSTTRFRGISVFNATGTTLTTLTGTSLIASSFQGLIKGGVSWNSTTGKLSVGSNNGAAATEVSGVTFPTASTTFRLGHTSTGALSYGGQIRTFYFIPNQSLAATITTLVA